MTQYLLTGLAAALAIGWLTLRIRSHRARAASDQETTWDARARGLPNNVYAAVVALAAFSILGVVVAITGSAAAPLGVVVFIVAAVAAAGLRRRNFDLQYGAASVNGSQNE